MSLKSKLLLTVVSPFLLLAACDQNTSSQSENLPEDDIISYGSSSSYQMDTVPPTLSGSFLAGQFAQGRSDWENAADYFSKILDSTPAESEIQRRIMALEMGSGHYEQALAIADKIIKQPTGDKALANLLMSLSNFKAGKYGESLNGIETYQNDALGIAILPLLKAWTEAGQGRTDVSSLKNNPSLLYQTVLVAAYTKDKSALADLAKSYDFTKTPTSILRLEDVALVFAHFDQSAEAKEIYTALKNALPDRATFYDAKITAIDNKKLDPLSPQLVSPQVGLSEALYDMARILLNGYQDSARLFAHMSLFLNPQSSESYELLAQIAADNMLYNQATTYLSRIDTTNSPEQKIQISRQIAQLQMSAGQTDEAIRILTELAEDNNIEAQIQIGDIYRELEKYSDALDAYNKAYKMLGNTITAKYWDLSFARGMINERLKNWSQAEKDLQTALLFEPDQPYVLNYLGYSWADQGINLDKAAELIEKAARLKPDDGAIIDSLGWIYFRMGQFDKAVATLEKAIQLAPTEPEINDHLGDAYWRVGRKSEANFQWKRAVSFTSDPQLISTIEGKINIGLPALSEGNQPSQKIVENNSKK